MERSLGALPGPLPPPLPPLLPLLLLLALPGPVLSCGPEYQAAVDQFCLSKFSLDMDQLDPGQWCSWEHTLEPYGDLTNCTFIVAQKLGCFWPNRVVDQFFVEVHRKFFSECALTGRLLQDPPNNVTGPFILVPVLVTLLMTGLVVWRSKRNEGIV